MQICGKGVVTKCVFNSNWVTFNGLKVLETIEIDADLGYEANKQ